MAAAFTKVLPSGGTDERKQRLSLSDASSPMFTRIARGRSGQREAKAKSELNEPSWVQEPCTVVTGGESPGDPLIDLTVE